MFKPYLPTHYLYSLTQVAEGSSGVFCGLEFPNEKSGLKIKMLSHYFNFLRKYFPDFRDDIVNDEYAFKKLFPGEKYDYLKLKNIISVLLVLGKEFLAATYFRNNEDLKDKVMLQQYRDRSLDDMFEQLHNFQ